MHKLKLVWPPKDEAYDLQLRDSLERWLVAHTESGKSAADITALLLDAAAGLVVAYSEEPEIMLSVTSTAFVMRGRQALQTKKG